MANQDVQIDFVDRPRAQATFGRAFTLQAKFSVDGTQQTAITATIDVKRPGGAACTTPVAASAVTVDGSGNMSYALVAGNTDLLAGNWSATWHVTLAAVVYDFVQLFDVVRVPLRNVVKQADLVRHHPDLADILFSGESDYEVPIEQAYEDVWQWLDSKGTRAALVISSEDLRRPIEHLALHKIFVARTSSDGDRWDKLSHYHQNEWTRWMSSANLVYDADESGDAASSAGESRPDLGMRIRI